MKLEQPSKFKVTSINSIVIQSSSSFSPQATIKFEDMKAPVKNSRTNLRSEAPSGFGNKASTRFLPSLMDVTVQGKSAVGNNPEGNNNEYFLLGVLQNA